VKLTERGTLEGKVVVTYTGLEALERRLSERSEDAQNRKQFLEDELKEAIPTGSDVTLTNAPDWDSSDPTMVAEFDISVPGYATSAGSRLLLQAGLFGAGERHSFEHAARVHPVYISYPNEQEDDIELTLPPTLQASSLPQPTDVDRAAILYSSHVEQAGSKLHLTRRLTVRFIFVAVKEYNSIFDFYQRVRAGDEESVVLSRAKPTQAH
jgi:hypothetical protein